MLLKAFQVIDLSFKTDMRKKKAHKYRGYNSKVMISHPTEELKRNFTHK